MRRPRPKLPAVAVRAVRGRFPARFAGPKSEEEAIRDRLSAFLAQELGLELSAEKTLITHADTEKARFLGYDISVA